MTGQYCESCMHFSKYRQVNHNFITFELIDHIKWIRNSSMASKNSSLTSNDAFAKIRNKWFYFSNTACLSVTSLELWRWLFHYSPKILSREFNKGSGLHTQPLFVVLAGVSLLFPGACWWHWWWPPLHGLYRHRHRYRLLANQRHHWGPDCRVDVRAVWGNSINIVKMNVVMTISPHHRNWVTSWAPTWCRCAR